MDSPGEAPHRNTIGHWEAGKHQPPRDAIAAAAQALGVAVAEIWPPKGDEAEAYVEGMEEVIDIIQTALDTARLRADQMREAVESVFRAHRIEDEQHLPDEPTGTEGLDG